MNYEKKYLSLINLQSA